MLQKGARWQKAQQLLHHPKADALTISAVVHLQEESQQFSAFRFALPLLAQQLRLMLKNRNLPKLHCNNGKSVAIDCYDILAAHGLVPISTQRSLEATTLRLIHMDLHQGLPTGSTLEALPTAGTLLTRDLTLFTRSLQAAVPSKFMLYLRADETVDIDTALQESQAEQPLSRDLWERLEGTEPHGSLDWTIAEEMQAEEGEKQMALLQATTELERAYAKRAKELKAMTEDEAGARSTEELFRLDREISGRRNLALLANVDLIFEQVAMKLEKLLEQSTISDWDVSGRQLKTWVYEFALLDKQVAPYRSYLQRKPQESSHLGDGFGKTFMAGK
eukprot:symbB.v1.2.017153.t1/scaffold1331.1/size125086/7